MPFFPFDKLKESIDIVQLVTFHGYTLDKDKSTRKTLVMRNGSDKIFVYPQDQRYSTMFDKMDGGDVIDFVLKKNICKDTNEAIAHLTSFHPSAVIVETPRKQKEPKPFEQQPCFPPDQDNYIVQKRAIPLSILQQPRFANTIYSGSSKHGSQKLKNCIIPLYNASDKLVGQYRINDGYKHLLENSNKTDGVWHSAGTAQEGIAVFETPINALSHYILFNQPRWYFATIGNPSQTVINRIVAQSLGHPLILCMDNDTAGQYYNLTFLSAYIRQTRELTIDLSYEAKSNTFFLKIPQQSALLMKIYESADLTGGYLMGEGIACKHEAHNLYQMAKVLLLLFQLTNVSIERSSLKDFNDDLMKPLMTTR